MLNLAHNFLQLDLASFRAEHAASHRARPLRMLFVHRDADVVDDSLQELKKARFVISADVVLTLTQCAEHVRTHAYDVIVGEYPSPCWKAPRSMETLREAIRQIPLLLVTTAAGTRSIAQLTSDGAVDYIEREHLAQLPMVVRRAVNEATLRAELLEAGKALRHSQSLYRALVENPAYGVCRCDKEGKFLDVNQALLTMLGYSSKEELIEEYRAAHFVSDFGPTWPLKGSVQASRIEPLEIALQRKDGTMLKARLSGRGILDEHKIFTGYEVIVVDITDQRALEDNLRRQASIDSLTGLANHGRLFETLHAEIERSKRTGRAFSLLLLDLDGLKAINDRHGHLAGDRALSRLARILTDCCRSVDTAARQGGDEFAVVLPETGVDAAVLVATRIRELLAMDTEVPAISASVGMASCPRDGETIGTLLYAADRALYAMKEERSASKTQIRDQN